MGGVRQLTRTIGFDSRIKIETERLARFRGIEFGGRATTLDASASEMLFSLVTGRSLVVTRRVPCQAPKLRPLSLRLRQVGERQDDVVNGGGAERVFLLLGVERLLLWGPRLGDRLVLAACLLHPMSAFCVYAHLVLLPL
jgi:hypothetical protein